MSDRLSAAVLALCAAMLAAAPARAQQKDEEAKAAYVDGKIAYEAKQYERALEHFKRSYTLSGQPALLYNIASTQQQLNHPGLAAEALRDYVKARPDDPDRHELEARIASLDKAQQLIDRDENERRKLIEEQRRRVATPENGLLPMTAVPGWLSEAEADRRMVLVREREKRRRRALAIGLGVGLGLIAAGAIAVGVVCGTGHCEGSQPHDFDFSKATVTP